MQIVENDSVLISLIIIKSILTKGVELFYNSYAKSDFDTTTEIVSLSRGLFTRGLSFLGKELWMRE